MQNEQPQGRPADEVPARRLPLAQEEKSNLLWIFGVVLVVALALAYYFWSTRRPAPPPVASVPVKSAEPVEPVSKPEPVIEHPIEKAGVVEERKPLPALNDSDKTVLEMAGAVFDAKALQELLVPPQLIRRIVATIDNLPRQKVAMNIWPLKPVPGKFQVSGAADAQVIAAANAARYEPYVKLLEQVDAKQLVALYVQLYPLFQKAYVELGYPKGYFNDRLIFVIDHLLQTPEVKGTLRVEQPKVFYTFADPRLEERSAGQKILLRMGEANMARVKIKLRAIRREVTGQMS